jgi:hypothetical protein
MKEEEATQSSFNLSQNKKKTLLLFTKDCQTQGKKLLI